MAKTIFFVDDEPVVRKAVKQTLADLSCEVRCFEGGESCLEAIRGGSNCDLLITDINMPAMNGVDLIQEVRRVWPILPVIAITGYGDIPMAVSAMKAGAADFLEKPLDETTLLPAVRKALSSEPGTASEAAERLTKAERRVLQLVASGKTNKEIAHLLQRSVRTVENHRHRLSRKLGASSTAELVKMAIAMGLTSPNDQL